MKRKLYSSASDGEKVLRNWNKSKGLYTRREYSVAVLRCGTCVELVVNFAIRQELVTNHKLPLPFADTLLKNANGLYTKFQNLFLPIMEGHKKHADLKKIWKDDIIKINTERNGIAHRGEFRSQKVAKEVMKKTESVLGFIFGIYGNAYKIVPFEIIESSKTTHR